jgi:hypothetical protein
MSRVALFLLIAMGWSSIAWANEVTLFDSQGEPIAKVSPSQAEA